MNGRYRSRRQSCLQWIASPLLDIYILYRRPLDAMFWNSIFFLMTILTLGQCARGQAHDAKPGKSESSNPAAESIAPPRAIVIGFLGGFIKHDNTAHSEVQLAARLRNSYPPDVYVETFESYHEERADKTVLALLDANHDGKLSPEEKNNARIVIYGHSWGGSEAIILARDLNKRGVPVLLTIQIDSVTKIHQNDAVIPANVAKAANFFQRNGHIHGQPEIRAADPKRTTIIGNFEFDYQGIPYTCSGYPWYDRIFGKAHTQIECDPKVWAQAEALIRAELPLAKSPVSQP